MHRNKKYIWKMTAVVILFAVVLTGFRLQWMNTFNQTANEATQPLIVAGQLDLRDWDFSGGRPITLNGEWEFIPYEKVTEDSTRAPSENKQYITVPGDWSASLNPQDNSPYGYGSYRLRILVSSDRNLSYGMRIPSVRSASEVYVNGLFAGRSGQVADNERDYMARNVPYSTSSIRADGTGIIEIVLQAANYDDPRSSGLVRSIKFGYEEDVLAETQFSTTLQIIAGAIFIVHALFACILYVIGIRDKRLLYFSLAVIASAFANLMGGDEKVLFNFISMSYEGSFKLSFIVMITFGWAMVHCAKPQIEAVSKKFLWGYTALYVAAALTSLLLPLESLTFASTFSFSFVIVSAVITAGAFLFSKKEFNGGIWLALSIVALASHFWWWAYSLNTGMKVIHYPFDLIIAVVCFAGVWFKQYHQLHLDTEEFAAKLQQADKVKDEFLANTSHELRNPLHSILNMSQALLERERPSMQGRSVKDLETVLSVSRRMSVMVNDLLDFTHLKESKPQLQLHPCSLQAVAAGVIGMLDYMIEGKPVRMVNKIPNDFPPVMADEKRMIQILFNLLHNAVKFTHRGEITVQAFAKEGEAQIVIADTGVGMAEETIKTIFEPYVQGRNGEGGGFGLGLNISRKLVALHGSTLQVQSVVGEGTTFSFSVPLADLTLKKTEGKNQLFPSSSMAQLAASQIDDYSDSFSAAPSALVSESPRILVVDDDPVNLQVIETMLSAENYEVTTALSGEEALSLLDVKEWDLIISDVMMPQISGYELTKRIRKRFSVTELPILLLTARSRSTDIENGFLAGANDYVTKPVDALEFKSRVRALTRVKQAIHEKIQIEAAWLQAQIQPHFLFNALNTIMALSAIDSERMGNVLGAFSHLLRRKFQFENLNELSPLEEEIELIESYLLIEKERFADRLRVHWEIDEGAEITIPALTIQPLVENAIHHGIMKRERGGQLTIRVIHQELYTEITVEDDGVGMEEALVESLLDKTKVNRPSGIGLLNTDLRLKRQFGQGLQIKSAPDRGTTISFVIPH